MAQRPLRCMPLGYVFYRQFSGLPVSTLAVLITFLGRKAERKSYQFLMCLMKCVFPTILQQLERFFKSTLFPGQKMSIVNCVATFVIIGIGLDLGCSMTFLLQENPTAAWGKWPIPPWELGLAALRFRHDLCPDRCLATIWSDPTSFQ